MPATKVLRVGSIVTDGWESFARIILPEGVGEVQRDEMRKAFYAGLSYAMYVFDTVASGNVPDEVVDAVVNSMAQEIETFARSLPNNGAGGLTDEPWKEPTSDQSNLNRTRTRH